MNTPVAPDSACKVTVPSQYFADKYGTPTPDIQIEDTDENVFGKSWMDMTGHPGALLYAMRAAREHLPLSGRVYYGKIHGLGELVHESEIQPYE